MVDFRPETLLISIYEVLKHRKTPDIDAKYISSTVIENLQNLKQPTFTTNQISEATYNVLKNYDKLASEIYKTVHKV
jgi:transcriptional regulator NrdR family protein